MAELLLVEDDLHLREALSEALSQQGYSLESASTCSEARALFSKSSPRFAVMDVGLPDGNGFELGREFLKQNKALKLLFLTAFVTPEDRLRGLELGAADYIGKPFHLRELILRLKNLSSTSTPTGWQELGKSKIHFDRFLIQTDQEERHLSVKERDLLRFLWEKSPAVVSREEIFDNVWANGDEELPTTRTIDNFILRLRKWIEVDPAQPKHLLSIWGVGYSLRRTAHEF